MVVNASLPAYRVWVAGPTESDAAALEVTEFCSGESGGFFSVSSTPVDSGWVRYQGQITLEVPAYDPRFDSWNAAASRWSIGSRVIVRVRRASGAFDLLPCGYLYNLSEPLPPYPGNWTLTLELGDIATLRDRVVSQGLTRTNATRDAIAAALWSQLGSPLPLSSGLPGKPLYSYSLEIDGEIVTALGELAAGAGALLWQNRGAVEPLAIDLEPARRLLLHRVGVDEAADFEPIQSPLRPATEVEVVSSSAPTDPAPRETEDKKYRGSRTSFEKLSKAAIVEGETTAEVLSAIRTESWQWTANRYRQTVEESRARGLVIPLDLYDLFPNLVGWSPFDVIPALVSETIDTYESSSEGRKLRSRTEIVRPRGQVLADWYKRWIDPSQPVPGFTDMILAEVVETEWSYQTDDLDNPEDAGGQVRKIKTKTWKTRGEIAANASDWRTAGIAGNNTLTADPTDLIVAAVREETWHKRADEDWIHTVKEWQAGRVRTGTIRAFTRLVTIRNETHYSRAGDIRPPAAERRPVPEDAPSANSANAAGALPPKGRVRFRGAVERKRQIEVNQVESDAEAARLAGLYGKLDHFRHRGFRITTALEEAWFSWRPLSRVDLDYNNATWIGLTDVVTFSLAANQAIVVADCMRIGVALSPYPDPPPVLGAALTQRILPVASEIAVIEIRSRSRVVIRELPEPVLPLPIDPIVIQSRARIQILDAVVIQSRARVVIEEPAAGDTLIASWTMDAEPWIDTVGGNTLTRGGSSTDPSIVSDTGGNVTRWSGDTFNTLECDGTSLATQVAAGNWSWRLAFEMRIGAAETGAFLIWNEEFLLSLQGTSVRLILYRTGSTSDVVTSTVTMALDTWYTVEAEYTGNALSIKVDNTTTSITVPAAPTSKPPDRIIFGEIPAPNLRLRNVEFFRNTLIPR